MNKLIGVMAIALAATLASVAPAAAQVDPGVSVAVDTDILGATRDQTIRVTVVNFSQLSECGFEMRFVLPGTTGPEYMGRLMPGELAKVDLKAANFLPRMAPTNARVEIGAVVRMGLGDPLDGSPRDPMDAGCHATMQVFSNSTGMTTAVAAGH